MISISNTPIQADTENNYIELWDDNSKQCLSLNCFQRTAMRDTSSDDWNEGAEPAEGFAEDIFNNPQQFDLVDIFSRH